MTSVTYEDRILSWFDIADFSGFVARQGSNADAVRRVYGLFEELRDILRRTHLTIMKVNFRQWNYHIISDTMAVSCPYRSHDELNILNFQTALFQMGMIAEYGLFVRGAMVFGKVYDKERDMIFGPAVIKAHKLEAGPADWFRILIDQSVVKKSVVADYQDLYKRDGKYHFLNYLSEVFHILAYSDAMKGIISGVDHPLDLFKIHKQQIESSASPAIRGRKRGVLDKYESLASYHNDIINIHCRAIERILKDKQALKILIDTAISLTDSTLVNDSTLWGLVSLLQNDLGIAGLPSNVYSRTSRYLKQLKKDLSTHIIETTCFHI